MRRVAPLLALLFLAFDPARSRAAEYERLAGRRVTVLSFRGDAPLETAALARLTEMQPGAMLARAAVATSLRNLYATRLFSDLAVEAAPDGDGVAVVVVYSRAARITRLEVRGAPVGTGTVLDATGLFAGDPWGTEEAEQSVKRVTRLLNDRGYRRARVQAVVGPGADDTSVDVRLDVAAGPRSSVGAPAFNGSTDPLRPADLARAARLKAGRPFQESRARAAAERIEAAYREAGYARAEVRYAGERDDETTNVVTPVYSVYVGSRIVLRVDGAAESEVRKHPESPWAKGEPPDAETVRRFAEALRRTYQEKGYARARVDTEFRIEAGEETVTFRIAKGDRFSISAVRLEGAGAVPRRVLVGAVGTTPRGLLSTGRLVDRQLERDRESIAGLYRLHGLPEGRVAAALVTDGRAPFTLDVTLQVEEGRPAVVSSVSIEGCGAIAEDELRARLTVTPGRRLSPADLEADLASLRGLYSERGFVDARLDVAASPRAPEVEGGPILHDVVFSVSEGEPTFFGKTVIRGNRGTHARVIERELAYREGDPLSYGKLIETQQNLARLGVFGRVELTTFGRDPETRSRTALLSVSEGKPWSLVYGLGAEYSPGADSGKLSPRLSFGASYNNLLGRALYAGLEARYSRRDTRLLVTLRERALFDWRLPVSLTVFNAEEQRSSFDVARRGAFLDAERRLGKNVKSVFRYQYEIVDPSPKGDDSILSELERENQQIAISSLGANVTLDTRDDVADPKSGVLVASEVKWAFPLVSADAQFVKGFLQASLYRPFRGTTLVFSARGGVIEPFTTCGPETGPTCPPNLQIPIAERFFGGGRSSHRAFPLDDLGIEGESLKDGKGIGGSGILIGNVEWRTPLYGDLGLSLFVDAGNVWGDYRKLSLSELRVGAGVGLHYLTPVGPLRVEYGRKLDRKAGESLGEFSFSIGYPF